MLNAALMESCRQQSISCLWKNPSHSLLSFSSVMLFVPLKVTTKRKVKKKKEIKRKKQKFEAAIATQPQSGLDVTRGDEAPSS